MPLVISLARACIKRALFCLAAFTNRLLSWLVRDSHDSFSVALVGLGFRSMQRFNATVGGFGKNAKGFEGAAPGWMCLVVPDLFFFKRG